MMIINFKTLKAGLKSISLLYLLTSIFSSCLFHQEEKNFRQVDATPNPKNKNDILYSYSSSNLSSALPIKDTLWLSKDLYLHLVSGAKVSATTILVNAQPIQSSGATITWIDGGYQISRGTLAFGTYVLTIKQVVPSGTKSIADKLGTEFAEFTSTYILVVEPNNSYVPKLNVEVKDGTIRLSWNKYNRDDFQYYRIVRTDNSSSRTQEFVTRDQSQVTLNDTTNAGGSKNYQLFLNNGGDLSSTIFTFKYTYSPTLALTENSDNTYRLSWTQPAIYKNIKSYSLSIDGTTYQTNQPYEDLSSNFHGQGQVYLCSIVEYAKLAAGVSAGDNATYSGDVAVGKKIPFFTHVVHDTQQAAYYLYNSYNTPVLYKMDDQTFNLIDTVVALSRSTNGKILISSNGQYHYLMNTSQIERFDPNTLSAIETMSFTSLDATLQSPAFLNYFWLVDNSAITDNNLLLVQDSNNIYSYVINMNTKSTVFKVKGSGHISSDGKYLAIGSDVYTYSSGTFIKVSTLPYSGIQYVQFLNGSSQLTVVIFGSVIIYDCASNTAAASYAVGNTDYPVAHLDQSSKKMYMWTSSPSSGFMTLDLRSGTSKEYSGSFNADEAFLEGDAMFYHSDYIPAGGYVIKNY